MKETECAWSNITGLLNGFGLFQMKGKPPIDLSGGYGSLVRAIGGVYLLI
ncbi:MAG: hypothetical protein ACOX86_00850 [Pelotomaculaceae bacterium]|jgi:hypothetical protein|uniref:Uncharacterized protein n=1 Tax=anaerobic digester metagenome TaxID=1263854 RepID=A0A485M1T4_9ZZZZ|nr:hypothetical protein [Bacillota bacterium]HHU87079.1 hypothetical protein [Peptococcaceae bacterium]